MWRLQESLRLFLALLLLGLVSCATSSIDAKGAFLTPEAYASERVLRFAVNSHHDASAVLGVSRRLHLDVWGTSKNWIDVRVSEDAIPSFFASLPPSLQTSSHAVIPNLSVVINESLVNTPPSIYSSTGPQPAPLPTKHAFFRDYQPFSVILPWMRLLASMFPAHTQRITVGETYEGREIPAFLIGLNRPKHGPQTSPPKKTIVIVGGSHAREWISVSTANYLAHSLITKYGKSPAFSKLVEEFNWLIVPTLNPDGYVYSWEKDRLWRKNRQVTALEGCTGLDLDRTWDYEWRKDQNFDSERRSGQGITEDKDTASSSRQCSQEYAGEHPFEAYETKSFASWLDAQTNGNNMSLAAFVDLHSYSQEILYPFAYTCNVYPPSLENLEETAFAMTRAIHRTHWRQYALSSACESFFGGSTSTSTGDIVASNRPMLSGSPLDYFYGKLGVHYSYQMKLRDQGTYGYLLPREHIAPQGKEVLNAVLILGRYLVDRLQTDGGVVGERITEKSQLSMPSADMERTDLSDGGDDDDDDDDTNALNSAYEKAIQSVLKTEQDEPANGAGGHKSI